MRGTSPAFGLFVDIFYTFFGFNSLTTIQLISLVPIICVFISALILELPILLPIFLSSESFVLLSFNGIRQGLSLGFLVLALSVLIKGITTPDKDKNLVRNTFFLVILFLILSLLSHRSSFVYIACASLIFILNN